MHERMHRSGPVSPFKHAFEKSQFIQEDREEHLQTRHAGRRGQYYTKESIRDDTIPSDAEAAQPFGR